MKRTETNIFPITNLEALATTYKKYQIRGLRHDEQYFLNKNELEKRVSFQLRAPALVLDQGDVPVLILPNDAPEPDREYLLVAQQIHLEKLNDNLSLPFADRNPDTDPIILRFLQFQVQAPLHRNPHVWQPRAGRGYYARLPAFTMKGINAFRGFVVRAILTPDGGIGLCFDISTIYVSARPLPENLTREEFSSQYKGTRLIYHYGYNWHEIYAEHLSELTVTEYKVDGAPLLSYITDHVSDGNVKLTREISCLKTSTGVVLYRGSSGDERAAPTALCYPIYGTSHPEVAKHHRRTQMSPLERRGSILGLAGKMLQNLEFGGVKLEVSRAPFQANPQAFSLPALEFGGGHILRANGNAQAFGRHKLQLLAQRGAGFFTTDRFRTQLLLLPKTVARSFGQAFVDELADQVKQLYPHDDYCPEVIEYDDQVRPTFAKFATAIRTALSDQIDKRTIYGAALVMVPQLHSKGTADELAAYVTKELEKHHIYNVAVVHAETSARAYMQPSSPDGRYSLTRDEAALGKYRSYLRNVALNKVLLTNYKWPFVLKDRTQADLTIGIDVKGHTVGIVMVSATASHFEYKLQEGRGKEKLKAPQAATYLKEALQQALPRLSEPPRTILIQRDGRLFSSEIQGIEWAIEAMQKSNELPEDVQLTFVELTKSSPVSLRLFNVTGEGDQENTQNPNIGSYFVVDSQSGFVCTTGEPLINGMNGTVRPLYVKLIKGGMSIQECLRDTFYLSCLTWTRPEGCMRDPITIRMLDRFLYEHASDFDEDGLAYSEFDDSRSFTLQELLK